MSFGSHEGRLLEVFSHFGMIQKESSSDPEEALINVVLTTPKQRLLKDIAQLTEAFLAMQSLSPAETVNYLSFVTGSLFELVSHPDQDVRMAADEGINQIIKVCFPYVRLVVRLYAIHILPALSGLITREEEMVWDCLSNSIQPVAVFIFPHTSQQELITILLKGLLEKIESDKNYIRRSAAKILASSVVHSRLPHELSYRLIQQLAGESFNPLLKIHLFFPRQFTSPPGKALFVFAGRVFVLKQRFLLDEASSETPATETATALQGCLWTLRNLASLFSRIPQPTSTGTIERTRSDGKLISSHNI
ncbi:unnamed protein product [Mesocestoides corti]|uniref:Uncharacterized protein n=1 Tax=Mesocestoides corti TaxID=53468 RepID=A0A0R3UL28_MESCO|nr:unnamed protein product [Mesocestoides corti]